jgi:hypothetical protein
MDHLKILKRAYAITLDYRVLWIFGIILALTTGGASGRASGGGSGGGGGGDGGYPPSGPGGPDWPPAQVSQEVITALIVVGVSLICLFILLVVIGTIARYVAETSLIKLVDRYEASGEKLSLREGFQQGWSRTALRLFLMDLLIGLPFFVVMILLLAVAAAPLLAWLTQNQALRVIGTLFAIGLGMLVILMAILAGVVLSVLLHFFRRVCVLEEQGVVESLRRGWALVRQRLGDVALMALILFVLGLLYTLVMIPVMLLLMLVAVVIAGLPALLAGSW